MEENRLWRYLHKGSRAQPVTSSEPLSVFRAQHMKGSGQPGDPSSRAREPGRKQLEVFFLSCELPKHRKNTFPYGLQICTPFCTPSIFPIKKGYVFHRNHLIYLVGARRFELPTP